METGKGVRRKFDKSFKIEAVQLVLRGDRTETEIAKDLGINSNMLNRWKRELLAKGEHSFLGKGNLTPQEEELRRLRKELRDVTEERDILKKATAIFSRMPR